jgi:PAS domain S-box-containing protein
VTGQPRILLVTGTNDDAGLADGLLRAFGPADVARVASASELAAALAGSPAHVVVADEASGWSDGAGVLRQVKERWALAPVIVVAPNGNATAAAEALDRGADDYVVAAPHDGEALRTSVERSLRHARDLRALSAATDRYRSLFERVPVGLYRYDPGGTLIECNQALLELFGAPDVETLRAAGFPRELYVDQADRDRWRAAIAEGAATGVEYRVRRLDGEVTWVRHSAKLVRSPIGDPMWFEGVLEDVTRSREAQEALLEAESRFRALVENGSDFIMVLDADGRMRYVSPSVVAELAHATDDLSGTSLFDLIHPDDADTIRRLIGRLVAEPDGALFLAARMRRSHGQWRSWEGVVTNRLREPAIGGLILNAHDVTARLEAHAQRLEAEDRYRDVFENVPIGLYRSAPDGRHIDVNPAMVQILGFGSVEEYLASNAHDLYVDQDERRAWKETVERDGVIRGFEERLRRPDGRVIWVRDSATAVRDDSGAVVMYDGNIEDITDRVEAERELQARQRQQLAIAELGRSALTDGPASAMIDLACRLGNESLAVGFVSYLELLADEDEFLIRASTGWPPDVVGRRRFPVEASPPGLVVASRQPLVTDDVGRDARFPPPARLIEAGIVSSAWVPVQSRDRVFGVFAINATEHRAFSEDEVAFVEAMAGILGEVIRRKETEDDLRKTLRQLHRLSDERQRLLGRLVVAQEEERQRLAGDIHDDPIQVMAAAAVRLDMVERAAIGTAAGETLERTAETVQQAIDRLRNLVFELRPPALDREGLAAAIRQYLDQLASAAGIDVALQDDLPAEPPREIRTAAYRIVQEALTNVRKHAGARSVRVDLQWRDGGIATVVTDDGVGFRAGADPSTPRPGHIGLQSMRERAEALGGWWRIESRPQGGTRMEFWLPDGTGEGDEVRDG